MIRNAILALGILLAGTANAATMQEARNAAQAFETQFTKTTSAISYNTACRDALITQELISPGTLNRYTQEMNVFKEGADRITNAYLTDSTAEQVLNDIHALTERLERLQRRLPYQCR